MIGKPILAVIATAILVLILYFFLDYKPPLETLYDQMIEEAMPGLDPEMAAEINKLRKSKSLSSNDLAELSSLWGKTGHPAISAEFERKSADASPSAIVYNDCGDRFFRLFETEENADRKVDFVYRAMYCFEKSLQLDSTNLDTKLKLADCLTEGTNRVMEGVLILREIDAEKPGDPQTNIRLARFALMSGQYDRAIARMKNLLGKDSLNLQARYLLAESYMNIGQPDSTIAVLKEGLTLFTDSATQRELRTGIKNLERR